MPDFDPARTPGAMGLPPVDAPRETTQPVAAEMIADQLRQARANEKALEPLVGLVPSPPRPVVPAVQAIPPSASRLRMPGLPRPVAPAPSTQNTGSAPVPAPAAAPLIILTDGPPPPAGEGGKIPSGIVSTPTLPLARPAPPQRPPIDPTTAAYLNSPVAKAARDLAAARIVTHQPAASSTDSPSRGQPTPTADPGKQITGGFGDLGEAQYFPLDGSELRELVRGLLSIIDRQLDDDLRFSMAVTYPRVAARVIVEIEAYTASARGGDYDPSFEIVKILPPHTKTPKDIARARADEVVFVVVAARQEMTEDGESLAPPNAIRAELGLAIPRKQAIDTPQGRLIVDLVAGGGPA